MTKTVSALAQQYAQLAEQLVYLGLFFVDIEGEFAWILDAEIVRSNARERLDSLGKTRDLDPADLVFAARLVIKQSAARASLDPQEALAAIGARFRQQARGPRYRDAAKARAGYDADAKHWAERHRPELIRQLADVLFATLEYGEVD